MDQTPAARPIKVAVRIIERIAGVILGLVTLLIVASAIGRYGFARPLPDAFDGSRLLLGVAIAWGMASVGYHGSHIKVDLLAQAVGPRVRRWINLFSWVVLFAATATMTWKIWGRVVSAYFGGDTTMDLRLAHWPFFLAIWAGLVATLFAVAVRIWLILRAASDLGEYDGIDEQLLEDKKK